MKPKIRLLAFRGTPPAVALITEDVPSAVLDSVVVTIPRAGRETTN